MKLTTSQPEWDALVGGMVGSLCDRWGRVSSKTLAREAAALERQHLWSAAVAYWAAASCMATGINQSWYQARHDWCQRRGEEAFAGEALRNGGLLPRGKREAV